MRACRPTPGPPATMAAPWADTRTARHGGPDLPASSFATSMNSSTSHHTDVLAAVLGSVGPRGVFDRVETLGDRIRCHAKDCPEPAWYELASTPAGLLVRFATPDRWLSESIESDLMHFGDPIEELVEEELAELGWRGKVPAIKHFRDDAKLYTFESPLPAGLNADADVAAKFLFAYEAAFRSLGDVGGGDDDE